MPLLSQLICVTVTAVLDRDSLEETFILARGLQGFPSIMTEKAWGRSSAHGGEDIERKQGGSRDPTVTFKDLT